MWIEQQLSAAGMRAILFEDRILVEDLKQPEQAIPDGIAIKPVTRDHANRLSVFFKLISRRLEEMGKGLQ